MLRIELVIHQCAPVFMAWFDCQLDKLLGTNGPGYPSALGCLAQPDATPFPGPYEQYVELSLLADPYSPCSYAMYRSVRPDYAAGEAHFLKQFPLEVELEASYINHLGDHYMAKEWVMSDAEVITLTYSPSQMHLAIDYDLYEPDPLLWLLRAITDEHQETREQLSRDDLNQLISHASEAEQAKWKHLSWLRASPEDAPRSPATKQGKPQIPAADAALGEWISFFNPPGRSGRPTAHEDIWAVVEVHVKGRPQNDVYHEWVEKPQVVQRQLLDPLDSFKKMLRRSGKKLGRNE